MSSIRRGINIANIVANSKKLSTTSIRSLRISRKSVIRLASLFLFLYGLRNIIIEKCSINL
uniref:Uncharacterized protein n=1 Tax=Angiostrongylus cantonensis TaxID=6313 RepID=A0A0K0CTB8_ANGCA